MEITKIGVEPREARGRNQIARLRQEGKVPAVLYGEGKDSIPLTVEEREFERHMRQHHKVFVLSMSGREQSIFLKDVQWDCLTDRPLHIDFLRIDLTKPIQLQVELSYLGHPVGLSKGGSLIRDSVSLAVSCLPAAIPESITVQVSHLDVDDEILAGQLELPTGVTLDVPEDHVICRVQIEAVSEEPEDEEGEEPTEPAVIGSESAPEDAPGDS